MATEVHQRTAAGAVHVPEPRAVRAKMFFALFDEMDLAERSGIRHFLGFQIFWREEKLFAVHQQDAVLFGRGDHLLAFGDSHGQRLFADDMFASGRDVFGHLRVQAVWRSRC